MTQSVPLVTILINNYNYGHFLHQAIDSALNQTYTNIEVVVVDDGSTDDSRHIISSYGNRIVSVLKENGGQASAFNAGITASRGEVICMLDADDFFYPDKVARVMPYSEPRSILYHRLRIEPGNCIIPRVIAPQKDYCTYAQHYGYVPYMASPTSGLVIRRELALCLLPLPTVRVSADDFVVFGAALLGKVIGIPDVLASYRVHGKNAWYGKSPLKPPEFIADLERYLNGKLVEAGKNPAIDIYHSMCAMDYVPQSAFELTRLGVSAFRRHADFVTFKFVIRTLLRAVQCTVSSPPPPRCAGQN
jgi:glycosyltransferase involved in cell wall biosynthesis